MSSSKTTEKRSMWRSDERVKILSLEVDAEDRRTLRTRIKKPTFDDEHNQVASHHSTLKLAKQVWKGRDNPQRHEWNRSSEREWRSCTIHVDGAISNGDSSTMPAKHVLELALDTLQRRDAYEIFAEPVDPDEVEDYYEIIQEPMDFGTMRAKLHEGMYHDLEEFEHDAFLIPENAMHFNSSTTIYFRQASAIHELAKKVFHGLKTDPDNFVSEFSGARRRSTRKVVKSHDSKNSTRCFIPKTSSSDVLSSLEGTLGQSSVSKGQIISSIDKKSRKRKIPTNFSTGRRRVSNSYEGEAADRRSTYLYWKSSPLRNEINVSYKQLMMLKEHGENSYRDSLMSFTKQLGPVAQMVAQRKLALGKDDRTISLTTNHVSSNATGTSLAGRCFRGATTSKIIDLTEEEEEPKVEAQPREQSIDSKKGDEKAGKYFKDLKKPQECGVPPRNEIGGSCSAVKRPSAATSHRDGGPDEQPRRPIILALENPHRRNTKNADAESRNKKSSASVLGKEEVIDYNKNPCTSRFRFDIPFLKARLQQMQGFYKSTVSSSGELGSSIYRQVS